MRSLAGLPDILEVQCAQSAHRFQRDFAQLRTSEKEIKPREARAANSEGECPGRDPPKPIAR